MNPQWSKAWLLRWPVGLAAFHAAAVLTAGFFLQRTLAESVAVPAEVGRLIWLFCLLAAFLPLLGAALLAFFRRSATPGGIKTALALLDEAADPALQGVLLLEPVRDGAGAVTDYRCAAANRAATRLTGLSGEELNGRLLSGWLPARAIEEVLQALRKVTETGASGGGEFSYDRGGARRWFALKAARAGKGLVAGLADLTEFRTAEESARQNQTLLRMAAEEEQRRHLAQLERITSNLPCAVYQYLVTADGRRSFSFVSGQIREIYGREPEELLGDVDRGYDLIHPDDAARVRQSAGPARAGETQRRQEFRIFRDEKIRWILDQTVPEAARDGGTLWKGFLMDITGQKELQDQLVAAREAAEDANWAKGEFLAVMSHEIRTPMNGVLGFAELLAKTPLEAEQQDFIEIIMSSGESLLKILDDILDFSRIESGRMEIKRSAVSPGELVESIRSLLTPKAAEKGIDLRVEIPPEVPEHILSDPGRLRQILFNLAGNAIKFTERGHVAIGLRPVPSGTSPPEVEFWVEDTGPGISEDKLSRIFDPFTQADSSTSRRYGGTGLGLAIAKKLVHLMGGRLSVHSRPGEGARFMFRIPCEPVGAAAPASVPGEEADTERDFARLHPLKILVVEDDLVNLRLIQTFLRHLGYEIASAANGREAVEQFRTLRPDCIFMDLHMPKMDGLEATQCIREIEKEEKIRPAFISALTADVLPRERERSAMVGMDEYLTKPLKIGALLRTLNRAFAARSETDGNAPGHGEQAS